MTAHRKPVCLVAGVGPGNGEAFVKTFANAGWSVAMIARRKDALSSLADTIADAHPFPCDLSEAADLDATVTAIETDLGPVDTLVYNAGKGVWGDIESVSAEQFEVAWRVNTLGLFLAAKRVTPGMIAAGRGTIIVIGATASMRGVAGTAAFAPAKSAQRTLTQSLARHLGPKGVHVAHIVVDGVVGGPETRAQFSDRADDAFIHPFAIAATALDLARQPRSAWTFELDLRPFNEHW
jgi:NADP-dependent 3-hydroxy acid dehydrogenase YdfG